MDNPQSFLATAGIDFRVKTAVYDETVVRTQLWDLSGSERFRPPTYNYMRYFHGFLLIFDVCDRNTFEQIDKHVQSLKDLKEKNESDLRLRNREHTVFLIGNKIDDVERRCVSTEEALTKASELGFPYYETSAKEGTNVFEAINQAIQSTAKRLRQTDGEYRPPKKESFFVKKLFG
eukprot:TRINITY_DN12616_c0_g1_i3.p1 TRINITY_DN12616_c0_g1~~TRINITY_DN12616_c0_g1_i3.p1  ORF type:complete len:176 (-),score=16.90 TRINITY_DN12616_c0_g1_i3:14-541(-)